MIELVNPDTVLRMESCYNIFYLFNFKPSRLQMTKTQTRAPEEVHSSNNPTPSTCTVCSLKLWPYKRDGVSEFII